MTFWCIWYCGYRDGVDPDKTYAAQGPFDPAFVRRECPPLASSSDREGINKVIKGLTRRDPSHRMDLEQVIILLESLLKRKPSPVSRLSSFRRSSSFQEPSRRRLLEATPHPPLTD
mmetsp:Transcript_39364/g.92564  ORF Transcript_39364/g.92564 Transcript_39364/m.92564 type:complete len:116 (+) Transcript_39364:3-350(+)